MHKYDAIRQCAKKCSNVSGKEGMAKTVKSCENPLWDAECKILEITTTTNLGLCITDSDI